MGREASTEAEREKGGEKGREEERGQETDNMLSGDGGVAVRFESR